MNRYLYPTLRPITNSTHVGIKSDGCLPLFSLAVWHLLRCNVISIIIHIKESTYFCYLLLHLQSGTCPLPRFTHTLSLQLGMCLTLCYQSPDFHSLFLFLSFDYILIALSYTWKKSVYKSHIVWWFLWHCVWCYVLYQEMDVTFLLFLLFLSCICWMDSSIFEIGIVYRQIHGCHNENNEVSSG